MQPQKYSSVIKWSLVIGILIVINLFLNYAISLVYESPKYEDFCKQEQVVEATNKEVCVSMGGQWNATNYEPKAVSLDVSVPKGYCDPYFSCQKEFNSVNEIYNRNVFAVLVVLGVILIAISFTLTFNWILSVSSSMGGVLSIIIGSIRYWNDADNLVRVVILFLALVALIYFALKKFKN